MTEIEAIRQRCVDAEDLLRDDVPALLDEVDRLTKLVAAQKEIIIEYAVHEPDCRWWQKKCGCGLRDAKEKVAALEGDH